ncbi:MAG: peptide chain release factor N(5)-glutamine methyltransferase [Bacteroidales bacterium]|jgi:release factor glutamine methyltransferase|nr:peptide chain release factor N(5)-glutamine methyltransferase [Bacteroidales bacterium]
MTILNYILQLSKKLTNLYDINESNSIAKFYCKEILEMSNNQFILNYRNEIAKSQLQKLQKFENELIIGKPIQYILGYTYFYDLKIFVNQSVLIPRQETEILVDYIVNKYKNKENYKILDICSGSGCIAIALKRNIPNSEVCAIDISSEALEICKKNAKFQNTEIKLAEYDILSNKKFPFSEKFDIIISNPPYVLENEKSQIKTNVLNYEPAIAIFVENKNPFIFYDKIAEKIQDIANKNSEIFFEINEKYAKEIIEINEKNQILDNIVLKDLNGKDRVIWGRNKTQDR